MKSRSIREFTWNAELWPLVDSWASEHHFVLKTSENNRRIYSKGNRLIMAPTFLEISYKKGRVSLEIWVNADLFMIMSLLKGKKAETGIESGGLTAAIPRKQARDAINRLLEKLGQSPVL